MTREEAGDLLLVPHARKERIPHRRIMKHDQNELHLRPGAGDLLLEPGPLLASGFEWRIGIQHEGKKARPDGDRVPAVRPQRQIAERTPPVLEAGAHVTCAALELVIAER